jgi:hypothetical protein
MKMAKLTMTMDGDKMCIAFFRKKQYTLTASVSPAGSGTITGAGKYDKNVSVIVEATPAIDYEFDHFEVNGETIEADDEEEPPIMPEYDILVTDYGTGSGTSGDPWTGIAAAIAAASTNDVLYCPTGYYQLAGAVSIEDEGLTLIGDGMDKTIIYTADAQGINVQVDNVTLQDFTIDGTGQLSGDKPMIVWIGLYGGADYGVCKNIEARNAVTTGIQPNTVSHCLFENIYAHHCGEHGLHPVCNATGQGKYNTYRNVYGHDNYKGLLSDNGLWPLPSEPTYNVYDTLHSYDNGRHGFAMDYQSEITIKDCISEGNGEHGMYLNKIQDSTITDCSFIDNGNAGIFHSTEIEDVTYTRVTVKNNNSAETGYSGMTSFAHTNLYFVDCEFYDDRETPLQLYGLNIASGTGHIYIDNSTFTPNKDGTINNPYSCEITYL